MKNFLVIFSFFICHNIYSFQEALKNSPVTKHAFDNFMFSWTAVFGNKENNHYEVDILHLKGTSRLKLYAVSEEEKILASTTYITKDKWYVIEEEKLNIYRPFEANYKLTKTYYYLMKSKLQFLNPKNLNFLGKYAKKEGNKYHFYIPLNQAEKESLRHRIDIIRKKLIPNAPSRAEEHFYLRKVQSLFKYIKQGKQNIVDTSGVITRLDNPDGVVEITDLKLTTLSDNESLTPKGDFLDLTAVPNWQETAFFSFNGTWQPGRPTLTKDCRFINLKTGVIRRLPFKGTLSTPQAINRHKGLLFLTGTLPGSPHLRPFVYNLDDGSMKPIGPRAIHQGRVEQISLSPNQDKIAILHNPQPHLGDLRQLIILELNSRKMQTYKLQGNPQRVCWHPDNKSIYYSNDSAKPMISLFSPGKVIDDIVQGIYPTLTPDSKKLLYLDLKDQLWKSCSLIGEKSEVFHKGLQSLQFPFWNSSTKGIFIQHGEESWPIPVIYDLNTQEANPITKVKGLWLTPVW
ncbi:MAG: hypothetical protein MK132_12870 [Lentisphaerales bacterium]|nr:hypothetical protein [Lentisphaerales bacterium]